MKCPNCKKPLSDDAAFCPYCGTKVEREIICPSCGTENELGSLFCKKCGTKLQDPNKKVDAVKAAKSTEIKLIDNKKVAFIFSIIAMSSMIFSLFLIFIMAFTPFLSSSFFPTDEFTIIGWSIDVLKNGNETLFNNYRYTDFANAIMLLLLLIALLVVSGVSFGISIPKFVKSLKGKQYFDFSKRLMEAYILFVVIFIYATRIAMNQDAIYADSVGGGVLFTLVFIPLQLVFNAVARDLFGKKPETKQLVIRIISRILIFIFGMVVISSVGGDRIHLTVQHRSIFGSDVNSFNSGNLDLIRIIAQEGETIYLSAEDILTSAVIYSAVAFVFEVTLLVLFARLLIGTLSTSTDRYKGYVFPIVVSSIGIILSIITMIMNNTSIGLLNMINDFKTYYAVIYAKALNSGNNVLQTVFSSMVLTVSIIGLCLDKPSKLGGTER